MKRLFTSAALFGLLIAGCPAAEVPAPQRTEESAPVKQTPTKIHAEVLEVSLAAEGAFIVGGPMKVTMTVKNPTAEPRTFCKYHTPFEGIRNDIFAVSASIGDVQYSGMMAKRAPPGKDDYITLAPGESKSATVDLSEGYRIAAGGYALSYRGTDISGLPSSGPLAISVSD